MKLFDYLTKEVNKQISQGEEFVTVKTWALDELLKFAIDMDTVIVELHKDFAREIKKEIP